MNLNNLRMSLKAALDNMWARIDARIHAIEEGGGGSGVTGVKGNAEASYRQGNVNITPANIGAVNKAGDTMTGPLTMDSNLFGALGSTGFRNVGPSGALSYLCTSDDFYGSGGGWNHFIICNHGNGETYYNYVLRLPFFDSPKYRRQTGGTSAQNPWYDFLTSEKTVTVEQGGTGETQGTIDITNQCTWNVPTYNKYLIYNPYLKMVFGAFSVIGNVANQASVVTLPSSVPIISKGPCGIGTSATSGVSIDVSFEGRNLKSSHSADVSVSEPRYVIQAYVG